MRLLLTHPEIAYRDCGHCSKYLYEESGVVRERMGRPVEWPRGMGPDCSRCPKCEGSERPGPEAGKKATLTNRNYRCLEAYFERRAAGGKVDAVARRNFGIIERLFEQHGRNQGERVLQLLRAIERR